MNLEEKVMAGIKEAMKAKDEVRLRSLRAIKAGILLAKTSKGAHGEMDDKDEMAILQKMVKQRKDSLEIFRQQGREDLAVKEEEEINVINTFLPAQMDEAELRQKLSEIISRVGATGPADMGKVMGTATRELAGKAEGRTISELVKNLLSGPVQ